MAQKFIVPITVRQLASAGSDAFTIYVDQDVYSRIQIQAGGRIVWGSGDAASDTNLYRDAANVLKTDDTFKAAGLFVDGIEIDPTGAASDQVLKFDGTKFVPGTASTVGLLNDLSDVTTASVATGDVLTWNGTYWTNEEPTGGGASVTVSESAPVSPAAGDLWFDSILGVMFIYYDSVWVEVGGGGVVNFVLDTVTAKGDLIVGTADGAADNLAVGANGTYLKANSSTATGLEWASVPAIDAAAIISAAGGDGTNGQALTTNGSGVLDFTTIVGTTEASIISAVGADGAAGSVLKTNGSGDLSFGDVALGTNTSGIYVADLVAGTGVTITNSSSESASPTISIGQSVGTSSSVQFANVTADLVGDVTGNVTGNITGSSGSTTGNAATATALQTARAISLTGDVSGSVSFNGTSDVSITATVQPNSVALGTDTTGNYMSDLTQGTGVTITHTPSEGSNATIAIGQAVGTSASVQFAAVTAPLIGNASTATVLQTARNIAGQSFDGSTNISIAPTDLTGVTSSAAEINILDGATLSTTELNYVDGVTSAIQTQLDNKASSTASPIITLGGDLSGSATFTNLGNATLTATIEPNSVALGTDTTGNYMSNLTQGTGVTITHTPGEGSNATIAIGQAVGTSASVAFAQVNTTGDVVVGGNLTVNGTTTTLNTETLSIEDNIVVLNSNVTGSPTTNAGIEVERGTSPNTTIRWNETSDKWEFTEDGSTYYDVASEDFVTSLAVSILDDISDVSASAAVSGDFLKYNGTAWINDPINLGTDTTGNYVSDVVVGTGLTISHTPGEGSSASVSLNATLDDLSNVTVTSPTAGDLLTYNGSVWTSASASGGASLEVSATAPPSPEEGNLWFNSTTLETYIYYDGHWLQASGEPDLVEDLTDLSDVLFTAPISGQFLKFDGTRWVNGTIPTINTLDDIGDVSASAAPDGYFLKYVSASSSWIPAAIPTINALDDIGDVSASAPSSGQFLKWNGTAWVPETIIGGATISDSAPASPLAGQLWFDSTVGKTFVYYDSQWIEVGGIGTGARMVSSSSAPASPLEGSMWFDTDTAQTFVYYDSSWIEIGASGITASVQDSAPAAPVSGQIWFNSLTGGTYVYYGTNWIEVGASPFSALVNTINAKGDLLVGTADNTIGGLGVGSANQVLTVDSSTATGLKWATPVSTGKAIAMSIVFGG